MNCCSCDVSTDISSYWPVYSKPQVKDTSAQSSDLQQLLQNKPSDCCQVPCVILMSAWKDVLKLLKSFIAASFFQCKAFLNVELSSGDEGFLIVFTVASL